MKIRFSKLAALLCFSVALNGQTLQTKYWETNGKVNSVVENNGLLYLGGLFNYVGPNTGPFTGFLSANGQNKISSQLNGEVRCIAQDSLGNWYVAGNFITANGNQKLAKLSPAGQLIGSFNPEIDGSINTMLVQRGVLYIGGSFQSVNGQERSNMAAFNLASGSLSNWNPGANGTVNALASYNLQIMVGGSFSRVDTFERSSLASVNEAGKVNPFNHRVSGTVNCISIADSNMYIGGVFALVDSMQRSNLAKLNPVANILSPWQVDVDGPVLTLGYNFFLANLYVGGQFDLIGGELRSNVACVDMFLPVVRSDFAPAVNNTVKHLVVNNNNVFIAGSFTRTGLTEQAYIAKLTFAGNNAPFFPGANADANCLYLMGDTCVAGGKFSSVGGIAVSNMVALSKATGSPLNINFNNSASVNGEVKVLELMGGDLLVAGDFSNLGSANRRGLGSLDLLTGNPTSWDPQCNGSVNAMKLLGTNLFVGGSFSSCGGQSRQNIAWLDGNTGNAKAWTYPVGGEVRALELAGGILYAGGLFDTAGGAYRANVVAFNLVDSSLHSWTAHTDGAVNAVASFGNEIILGGNFSTVKGSTRNYLAVVDTTLAANLSTWAPAIDYPVMGMFMNGEWIYPYIESPISNFPLEAKIFNANKQSEALLDLPLSAQKISCVQLRDTVMYVGGLFGSTGSASNRNFAAFAMNVAAPAQSASNIQFSNVTPVSMRVSFTKGNGKARLVLASSRGRVLSTPSNGNTYAASQSFGLGNPIDSSYVVYNGIDTTFVLTGLQKSTRYHFAVIEYNGMANFTAYKNTAIPKDSQTTIAGYNPPTVSTTNLSFSDVRPNQMTLKWTKGNGDARIVVASRNKAVNAQPRDSVYYNVTGFFPFAPDLGGENYVVYNGTEDSCTVFGLIEDSTYHFSVYEYNGIAGYLRYKYGSPATGNQKTLKRAAEPSNPSSAVVISNITSTTMKLNWTKGNGASRMVIANTATAVSTMPNDGESYMTDNNYSGNSSYLSGYERVVYIGTGDSITVRGLTPNTTYHFAVVEFNGSDYTSNYKTDSVARANGLTLTSVAPPSVAPRNLVFTTTTGNSIACKWTRGNGDKGVVFVKKAAAQTAKPANGKTYLASAAFGSGDTLADGSSAVFVGTLDSTTFSNLDTGTVYFVTVYEYAESFYGPVYRLDSFASGNKKTASLLGLRDFLTGKNLSVYPNPVSDVLTIEFGKPTKEESSIELYDLKGNLLGEQKAAAFSTLLHLDTSALKQGAYLLKIRHGAEVLTKSFMVSH